MRDKVAINIKRCRHQATGSEEVNTVMQSYPTLHTLHCCNRLLLFINTIPYYLNL